MKRSNSFFSSIALAVFLTIPSLAANQNPGTDPSNASTWTTDPGDISNVQFRNSGTGIGNIVGTAYWFAAVNSDLGPSQGNGAIVASGNGQRQISAAPVNAPTNNPNDIVSGGGVDKVLGNNSAYFVYAQACDNGTLANSASCSSWIRLASVSVQTQPLPAAPFITPVAGDVTTNSILVHANVPDPSNVQNWHITINSLNGGGGGGDLGLHSYSLAQQITVGPAGAQPRYVDPLDPNRKYTYTGQTVYFWNQATPVGGQTEPPSGAIWTTPVNPGPVSFVSKTHCSIVVNVQNSNGSPTNPTYTPYQACVQGGPCSSQIQIGGTGIATDSQNFTINGLNPNTPYTPEGQALVGDGSDATANGWNNSGFTLGSAVTTNSWGSNTPLSLQSITTTSAVIAISGLIVGPADTWQIVLDGSGLAGASFNGTGAPPATVTLTGLTPNTQHHVQIKLTDASGASCNNLLPVNPGLPFTTTPNDPTTFTLSAASPFSLNAGWATSGNPGTTVYQVQYCTDAGFTLNCQTKNSGAGATSTTLTTGVNPATTYFAHVKALTIGGGSDSNYSNSASATTPPDVHSITIIPSTPQTINVSGFIVFSASVTDPSGSVIPGQAVNWAVSGGGNLSVANGPSTKFTATTAGGPFTLTASLATYTDATSTITVNATGPAFTTQPTATVNPDDTTGSLQAVATDQALNATAPTYTWSLESGPGAVSFGATNGTTTGNNVSITFSKAGSYTFRCIAADNFGNAQGVTPAVVVNQDLSKSLKVCPAGVAGCPADITVQTLQNQQFTVSGFDQFGDPMTISNVTWLATGAGNINSAGVFSSAQLGVQVTVTASVTINSGPNKGKLSSGSALVNVISFDVSGAFAYPVPYKANQGTGVIHFKGLGSSSSLRIYTSSGRRVFDIQLSADTYDWPIKNSSGESIASGVYSYVIESPAGKKNGKLIIIQ